MVTGVIKNKIDKIWTDIWAGGITNPLICVTDDLIGQDIPIDDNNVKKAYRKVFKPNKTND